jgi:DNA recombination protein RmuC
MRQVVDEKLQKTLNDRISQSFKEVSDRLAEVYKGLGEMQTIATSVGDLKKTLSNVKARGILGEIQLGAILEDMLSPEQYLTNVVTVEGSRDPVEFAIKLPGSENGSSVLLPIDSKFPLDAYGDLNDAYDKGNADEIAAAKSVLTARIKKFADDIHKKYVSPPATTEFAIMFLPTEGLYAEVVRLGLIEVLQEKYKVTIAGPTTMSALLNSLQMGFKTLAIQKRSGEVWETLAHVKREFGKFEDVLEKAKTRLDQANKELEDLVGTRTRQINRRLKDVVTLTDDTPFLQSDDQD